jgi:molybdenum cofactor cytidylyltransferase
VLGPDADDVRPHVAAHSFILVENPAPDSGPIGSLRLALDVLKPARPSAVLAWPVDVPHVRITTVERLIDTFEHSKPAVVVPAFGGRRGHPVLWPNALFEELQTSAAAAREGARAVLHRHDKEVVTVAVDDPAVIDDIDTPEDYERLIREINRDAF